MITWSRMGIPSCYRYTYYIFVLREMLLCPHFTWKSLYLLFFFFKHLHFGEWYYFDTA